MRLGVRERGATTVYFALFSLMAFGFLVMAADFGRIYLVQGELQTAADAAALAAATRLVGATNVSVQANDQVTASFDSFTGNDNRFNLRINQIGAGSAGLVTTTQVNFFSTLADARGDVGGVSDPSVALDWGSGLYPKYVKVQISGQAPVLFAPFVNRTFGSLPTVTAAAIAGISAPMCTVCGLEAFAVVAPSTDDTMNYGFIPGDFYTLYLTSTQRNVGPVTQAPLTGTDSSVQYALLNHIPSGPADLDLDAVMFQFGAAAISNVPGLDIPGNVVAGNSETLYPSVRGSTSPTVGQDILCGLNVRFAVDPMVTTNCSTLDGGAFVGLVPLYTADSDVGGGTYAAGDGLQDFATEYAGNFRRVLTLPIIDATDTVNVINFRQFLIEMSPVSPTVTQGLNTALNTGGFRVQYLGAPVPLRCGGVGGLCAISQGVGRTVLHQ